MTVYDMYYEKYIKEGYYPEWASEKARKDVRELQDRSMSITVDVPGCGDCQYTGD